MTKRRKANSWKSKLLPKVFSNLDVIDKKKRWQRTLRPELIRNHLLAVEPFGGPRNISRDGKDDGPGDAQEEEYHLKEDMLEELSQAGSGD